MILSFILWLVAVAAVALVLAWSRNFLWGVAIAILLLAVPGVKYLQGWPVETSLPPYFLVYHYTPAEGDMFYVYGARVQMEGLEDGYVDAISLDKPRVYMVPLTEGQRQALEGSQEQGEILNTGEEGEGTDDWTAIRLPSVRKGQ